MHACAGPRWPPPAHPSARTRPDRAGITSAVASLGMVHMWDVDDGFTALDRFGYAPDVHVRAGYALGLGLVHCGLSGSMDVLMPLLADHLTSTEPLLRVRALSSAAQSQRPHIPRPRRGAPSWPRALGLRARRARMC